MLETSRDLTFKIYNLQFEIEYASRLIGRPPIKQNAAILSEPGI